METREKLMEKMDWLHNYYTQGDSKLELKESNKDGVEHLEILNEYEV